MTRSTWSAIDTAFRDKGCTPIPEPEAADGSVRRTRTQEYLNSVDWTDAGEVSRAICAFERLLVDVRPDGVYGASKRLGRIRPGDGAGVMSPFRPPCFHNCSRFASTVSASGPARALSRARSKSRTRRWRASAEGSVAC
jgi:hypothetical protein